MNNTVTTEFTDKGMALVLAIQSGLCPRIEGGYDTTNFEKFWESFEEMQALSFAQREKAIKAELLAEPQKEKYYTTDEVAEHLMVIPGSVRRWIASGKLAAYKVGKTFRVSESQLQDFMKKCKKKR